MGQKVNPVGLRLGINRTTNSRWYANKGSYPKLLSEDLRIQKYIEETLKQASISRVVIERPAKKARVTIYSGRPGLIIGKKGADIETLKKTLEKMTGAEVAINIVEIRNPDLDAKLVGDAVAQQLERRIAFRRAMKRAIQTTMRAGALGIRINVSGRLGGAEIARMEWYREGRVPLHTLRADIDYGLSEAKTTYGVIGVKVWIFKGDIMEHDPMAHDRRITDPRAARAAEGGGGERRREREPRSDTKSE